MTATPEPGPAEQVRLFLAQHQQIIAAALCAYRDCMGYAAMQASESYAAIAGDPLARAAQDHSLITTEGLRMAGEVLLHNAARADAAHRDLTALHEICD